MGKSKEIAELGAVFNQDSGNIGLGVDPSGLVAPLNIQADTNARSLRVIGRSDDYGEIDFMENDNTTILSRIQAHNTMFNIRAYNVPMQFQQSGTTKMVLDTSGNVGIGTSSPSAPIEISRSDAGIIQYITNTGSNQAYTAYGNSDNPPWSQDFGTAGGLLVGIDHDETGVVYQGGNKALRFGTNATERMRVRGDGNIHINSTTPDLVGNTTSLSIGGSSFGGDGMLSLQSGWGGTTYGRVFASGGTLKIGNPQSGSVELYTANLTRLKIDSAGRVTTPYQPAFWVRRGSDLSGYNPNDYTSSVTFNHKIYDTGNNFNTSTGLFTAPVTGIYLFWASIYASSGSSISQMWLTYNGSRNEGTDWTQNSSGQFITMSAHVKLNANDTIGVHPYGTVYNIIANSYHTWFKGILVG